VKHRFTPGGFRQRAILATCAEAPFSATTSAWGGSIEACQLADVLRPTEDDRRRRTTPMPSIIMSVPNAAGPEAAPVTAQRLSFSGGDESGGAAFVSVAGSGSPSPSPLGSPPMVGVPGPAPALQMTQSTSTALGGDPCE
jgi:hypothetical protein